MLCASQGTHIAEGASVTAHSEELLQLVASQGDVRLTAERTAMTVPQLTARLLADPVALQSAVSSSVELQLLDLLSNLRVALIASLGEMSPKEMTALLAQIVSGFGELRGEGTVNNNLINFPVVNSDSSPARDKLQGRLAQLAAAAEAD